MQLELLQAHDLLLYGGPRDHPVDVHHFLLSYSVGSVHCLQVLHWVPVMLNKDHLGGHSNHHTTTSEAKGSHQGTLSLGDPENTYLFGTVSAPVRLRPNPPTLVERRSRSMLGSELNLETIVCLDAAGTDPSNRR